MVLVLFRERSSGPTTDRTAHALHARGGFGQSLAELEHTISAMIDAGQKYLYLEKALGLGVCFVLGIELSETQSVHVPK